MTNQDVFFLATEKGLVCWNFKEHRQFLLDYKHAARLIEIVYGKSGLHPDRAIDDSLIKYKVLVTEKNEPTLWGWDALSRIFHIGTRDVPVKHAPSNVVEWANAYTAVCAETLKSPIPPENHLDYATPGLRLPAPQEASKLDEIFSKRTTARNFFDTPVPLEIASTLLHCALGFLPDREHSPDNHMPAILGKRRCSPSSGGLNAVEGYLYARNISTLETGIYYYDPHYHALQIHERNLDHLGSLLAQQHFIDNLPLGIFFTARLDKLWWKYPHSKAYRMAIFEIGHIAQTFQLKATELGMKTWLTGALNENLVEKNLHLKHSAEQVLFFVGAGYSDGSAVPSVLTK